MDLAPFFAELDARPWADYEHAYGSAADVPDCLRALAGDDEEAADEALGDLYASILHQGSVYEASAQAVPFLARLAALGIRTADLLALLGGIAEGGTEFDGEGDGDGRNDGAATTAEAGEGEGPGESDEAACRRAVVGQLPLLLASVGSDDAEVRQCAVWAAAMTGAAGRVLPVLRERAAVEKVPLVRAELLSALAQLDPAGTASAATEAIGPDHPAELRITALLACVDTGLPWGRSHHGAMLSLLPAEGLMTGRVDQYRAEPLLHVTDALLLRDTDEDRDAAFTLLDAALSSASPEACEEAVRAAESACRLSRGAPQRLAAPLLALATGPRGADVPSVRQALKPLGALAAPAADTLARLAEGEGDAADGALEVLVAVAPERAAPLLARNPAQRPRALDAACGGHFAAAPALPYDSVLLAALRQWLTTLRPGGNSPFRVAALLESWGADAADAVPELCAALPRFPRLVPKVLAAVCPPGQRGPVGELLRTAARSGPAEDRFEAARALYALTGDGTLLLAAVAARLADDRNGIREAAAAAAELGPAAAGLVPALRAAFNAPGAHRSIPEMQADIEIAAALHRITGDPAEAVPVLTGVLSDTEMTWTRWAFVQATRVAAGLGTVPADGPLVPALEALLTDPAQVPGAVLALLALAPGRLDAGRTAGLLLDAAESGTAPVEALEALISLGPEAGTEDVRGRLVRLAGQDLRLEVSGVHGTAVLVDERARVRARAAVGALGGGAASAG
ncbi:hypothetical protein PUR49_15145 [Streptomyces sp. BE147]|uniref:hypothetical protein n=1 Tax=Streptomyces sp. BE147 TaxID=3002524 RepID=UPI002E78387F|nr:hypothetical protein [Streptomyces sp. BE147]MEE1737829.1 hypothetical protein [Streptomyces sp. BE147]